MNEQTEIILNQDGQETDLAVPDNFGQGLSFLNPNDMPDLEAAEVGFNIQPESLEFKVIGDTVRAVFNGFTYLKVKDQANPGKYVERQAAVLQAKTGVKINMGANLLKQLKLIPVGTAVQITYKGEEPTNGGRKVKVYDVNLLNVARANVAPMPRQAQPTPVETVEEPAIEIIDPLHFWAVTEAAKFWNMEAGAAAREIGKAKLPKMSKQDFLDWLKDPQDKEFI